MSRPLQRDVFLSGEGDAWFKRNRRGNSHRSDKDDLLLSSLLDLPLDPGPITMVAEVGCGQGLRLQSLMTHKGWTTCGIDPSTEAVAAAVQLGVDARAGTAEKLPYADNSIDLLLFGFCLYLCDRDDLFQIAAEAHRVLKPASWLAILDFWSPYQRSNPYHHRPGLQSFKSDLPAMFLWHPSYVITDHRLRHHASHGHTDDADHWVSATVMRRNDNPSL